MTRILALVVFVTCLPASAAIVYEPVQYQYSHHNSSSGDHSQRGRYYYGGSDVSVHRHAQRHVDRRTYRDAEGMISNVPARVYSDSIPRLNAALYGWTANDAKNQAYASVPRYFRKADLMYSSHRDHAGNLIVPATPPSSDRGSIEIKPWKGFGAVHSRRPVLIYPKSKLNLDAPLTLPTGEPSKA